MNEGILCILCSTMSKFGTDLAQNLLQLSLIVIISQRIMCEICKNLFWNCEIYWSTLWTKSSSLYMADPFCSSLCYENLFALHNSERIFAAKSDDGRCQNMVELIDGRLLWHRLAKIYAVIQEGHICSSVTTLRGGLNMYVFFFAYNKIFLLIAVLLTAHCKLLSEYPSCVTSILIYVFYVHFCFQ